jgi:hypothetical protein
MSRTNTSRVWYERGLRENYGTRPGICSSSSNISVKNSPLIHFKQVAFVTSHLLNSSLAVPLQADAQYVFTQSCNTKTASPHNRPLRYLSIHLVRYSTLTQLPRLPRATDMSASKGLSRSPPMTSAATTPSLSLSAKNEKRCLCTAPTSSMILSSSQPL